MRARRWIEVSGVTAALILSALLPPDVAVGQRESKLDRLEGAVGALRDNVAALEAALGVESVHQAGHPSSASLRGGDLSNFSSSDKRRVRRLHRRLARLDGRISVLEEVVGTGSPGGIPRAVLSEGHGEDILDRLLAWLNRSERRVTAVQNQLPATTPVPSPSGDLSPSPSPSIDIQPTTPPPTTTPSPSPSVPPSDPSAVRLGVGDDFQEIVRNSPPGTRFVIASGVHRLQDVVPRNGQVFTGEPGAVMSGARILSSFGREGALWYSTGQTQQGFVFPNDWPGGIVVPGHDRDNRPEELFFDGVRLRHVASKAEVVPGTWFFDYGADRIYLADDPAGHLVETSVADHAFSGVASGVVIENLTLVHYANPPQRGAIEASRARDWTIGYVDASFNHGAGISLGPGSRLHHSKMTYNGQIGLRAFDGQQGAAILIEDNEIAHNPQLGYNWGWEAGGMKISGSTGTIVRNNWVHENDGPGIWFDGFNHASTIESNLVEGNSHMGIFYEISYGPTKIRWNISRNNGPGQPGAVGAGILVANSREVLVTGNAVDSNARGIMVTMVNRERGPDGRLETVNVVVRNNEIRMLDGTTGLVDETGNDAYYLSKGNRFEDNVYYLDGAGAPRFSWIGRQSAISWASWWAAGNDAGGEVRPATEEPGLDTDISFRPSRYGQGTHP
jgi:Right handed beta helix region